MSQNEGSNDIIAATSSENDEPKIVSKFKTTLGNQELTLELDSDSKPCQLELELANASRFVVHRKLIKQEDVRKITGGIVDSPALFYESIRTLLQESSSAGSVEFHEKSYTLVIKTKLITIPVTWNILMERLESTADVKCQFLVKQIEKLAAFNEELSARVKHLEEINGTPAKVERSLFAAVNLANFTLSGDRKTISKNVGTGNGYQGFLSEHSIAAMGNKFTVALTNMGTNLMVGVARKGTAMAGGIYSKAGSWMLYFNNGQTHSFFANGAAAAAVSTRIAVNNGSQLSVRLDPLNEQIYFRVNGSVIYTADIQKPYADFFAAVDCYDAGQSLSFV